MKIYTQEELDQICTTFAGWVFEYDKRFLYATLKQDSRMSDSQDYMEPEIIYKEWYDKFGRDFRKVMKKYAKEKIGEAAVEIRHFLTFGITEFVENYFADKEQYTYFVARLREKALADQVEIGLQSDSDAFSKYAAANNYIEKFAYDLIEILGRSGDLTLQFKIFALFSLFFIHLLPVFVNGIFEGTLRYVDIRKKGE